MRYTRDMDKFERDFNREFFGIDEPGGRGGLGRVLWDGVVLFVFLTALLVVPTLLLMILIMIIY